MHLSPSPIGLLDYHRPSRAGVRTGGKPFVLVKEVLGRAAFDGGGRITHRDRQSPRYRRLPRSPAATTALVDRLEETQTISIHEASGHEAEEPRVRLFHAPGAGPRQNYEPAHAGHYWELEPQNEEDLPGAK